MRAPRNYTVACLAGVSLIVVMAANMATAVHAADAKAAAAAKPASHIVTSGPLKIEVELEGLFEADQMSEIVVRPKSWSTLEVLEAVAHGQKVSQGQTLVKLDMTKIDTAIKEAKTANELAEISLAQAIEDLAIAETSHPIELKNAEQVAKVAAEDLKRYLEIEAPMAVESAKFSLKTSERYLLYQKEELRQLEKMYKQDDLTEETEEIILQRARNTVEAGEFSFAQTKLRSQRTLTMTLPRQLDAARETARVAAVAWQRAKMALPAALQGKKLALLKQQRDHRKATDKFKELVADRDRLIIKSPVAGIVYYGKCTSGKWSGGSEARGKLRPDGKLTAGSVVMTIVNPDSLHVRVSVPEKNIGQVRSGMSADVVPTNNADARLGAKISSLSSIPVSGTSFEAKLALEVSPADAKVVAGMTCKVKVLTYFNAQALAVPSSAVFTDEVHDQQRYVLIKLTSGKHERRNVKAGHKSGDKTEIMDGLKVGDSILIKKP